MEEQATCGRGLAQNSLLPGKLGEWAAGMAENLDVHMRALDADDPDSRPEYKVHYPLANEHRALTAFEKVVKIKQELMALLEQTGDKDQSLLAQMRSAQR